MGINNVLELYRAVLAAEAFERVEAAYSALFKRSTACSIKLGGLWSGQTQTMNHAVSVSTANWVHCILLQ